MMNEHGHVKNVELHYKDAMFFLYSGIDQSCDQHKQKQSNYNHKPAKLYFPHMCIYLFLLTPSPKKGPCYFTQTTQMGISLPSVTPTP